MINCCINTGVCRRKQIADHKLKSMETGVERVERSIACDKMCDICDGELELSESNVGLLGMTDYGKATVDIPNT